MATVDGPASTAAEEAGPSFRFVGRRVRRAEAPERLTGRTRFAGDVPIPVLLHARLVRSPHPAARVLGVDRRAALAVPGVVGVYTLRDLPVPDPEQAAASGSLLLALDRVLYAGQPVAVVLGETEAAAADGAEAVQVAYQPLPAISDPLAALEPDAPVVKERSTGRDETELAMHGAAPGGPRRAAAAAPTGPNVTNSVRFERGDVEKAFGEAAAVVEHEFRTAWLHQAYLEPQVCVVDLDPLGGLVVYASTQALFYTRRAIARALGLPDHQVRVCPMPVGGAFGGKVALVEPLAAALALAARRPVRLSFTRLDDFLTANPAPQTVIRVRAAAAADGTLSALQARLVFDAGCGAGLGAPMSSAAAMLGSTYRWPNLLVEGLEVLTNKPHTGAYRAPGAPQATFAVEGVVDELARCLGQDALAFRRRNVARAGDQRPDGSAWPALALDACLDTAEAAYRAQQIACGPGEGVGIAVGAWHGGVEPASAICRLNSDGTLQVAVASVDLTGTNTTFQVIAAESFGLDSVSRVRVTTVDSDAAPYAGSTTGSKVTHSVGSAVQRAAQDAREQVLRIAAAELEAAVEDLEVVGTQVQVRGIPNRAISLERVAACSGGFGARYEPVLGRGQVSRIPRHPGCSVHVVRVRVDPETGHVAVVRCVVVQDVGRALNPATVEEQMHGGAAQGMAWGLFEALAFDTHATPLTTSLADYALPTAAQTPAIDAIMVEVPAPTGPFGAKGVGEPPIIPGPAALANAIRDATGARLTTLPLRSEQVWATARAVRSTQAVAPPPGRLSARVSADASMLGSGGVGHPAGLVSRPAEDGHAAAE